MVDDDGLDDTVSCLIVGSKCPIRQMDDAQPSNRQQRRDEYRRRHCPLGLHLQVGAKRGTVGSFPLDALHTRLITLLAHGSVDYGPEQRVVHIERPGEPVRNMQGDYPGQQCCAERFMTFPKTAIAETMDKITAAQAKRPCALQDEPSDRVCVLSEARLKYWRHRAASIRLNCPGCGLDSLIRSL
jgi:hypothetical protein